MSGKRTDLRPRAGFGGVANMLDPPPADIISFFISTTCRREVEVRPPFDGRGGRGVPVAGRGGGENGFGVVIEDKRLRPEVPTLRSSALRARLRGRESGTANESTVVLKPAVTLAAGLKTKGYQ